MKVISSFVFGFFFFFFSFPSPLGKGLSLRKTLLVATVLCLQLGASCSIMDVNVLNRNYQTELNDALPYQPELRNITC